MERRKKDNIVTWSAVGMLIFGAGLTTAGFCISPVGEVHDSVLWILGQCLIYSGSVFGILHYSKQKLNEIEDKVNKHIKGKEDGNCD